MARGRGIAGSARVGMTPKVQSNQNRNLFIHVPFVDRQQRGITNGTFPNFKVNKGNFVVKWNDPNNRGRMVKHPTRGLWMPRPEQWGGGNGGCCLSLVRPSVSPGYNSNNKNYRTPKRFTASIWFRQEAFAAQYVVLMGEIAPGYDSAGYNWWANWMVRLENNIKPRFYICDGTSSNYLELHAPTGSYSFNKDNHIVMTYDGATLKGYINAVQVVSGAFSFGVGQTVGNIEIASCRQSLFNEFGLTGLVWDFRMYSEAFSPAQIRELYNYTNDLYAEEKRGGATGIGANVEQSVTQSITSSDSIVKQLAITQTIIQSTTLSQTVSKNLGFQVNVSHSLTASQIVGRAYLQSVSQTVTAADTVAFTRSKFYSKLVSQSFATYQDVAKRLDRYISVVHSVTASQLPQNDLTNIRQYFSVSHVIAFNRMLNQRVSQSFTADDFPFVNSPRLMYVSQAFTTDQTASGRNSTNRQSLTQTVTAAQTVAGRNSTFRFAISQSITTGFALLRRDAIIRMSITQDVTTTHRVNTIYFKRVEQDINAADFIDAHRHVYRTFHTDTVIDHSFVKQRVVNRTVGTTLQESSSFDRQVIYGRSIDTPLVVEQNIIVSMQLSAPQIYLPEISGGPPQFGQPNSVRRGISGIIPVANLVKLDSGTSTILLPVPQLQNTLGDAAEVVVKRTISGKAQAYVKTTGQQRFTYTFWLDMIKALELRDWVIANGSKQITLTNWRGEAWKGNITTDQPQFTYEGLRKGDALEKVTITLSFQGVKLYG